MKVFLVGMPGSGKSTLCHKISHTFNVPAIDLDDQIEKDCGKTIPNLFSEYGEEYFRQVEHQTLVKVINQFEGFIMATGGGTPCYHDNMSIINETGLSFYLETPIDTLIQRLENDQSRPLLKNDPENLLRKLFETREPVYLRAHHVMTTDQNLQDFNYLIRSKYES